MRIGPQQRGAGEVWIVPEKTASVSMHGIKTHSESVLMATRTAVSLTLPGQRSLIMEVLPESLRSFCETVLKMLNE